MKNFLIGITIISLIVSCSGRKEYNDEDYKQKQTEYEKKKAELFKTKGELYKENKERLMELAELFKSLKDTSTSFENVPSDTNFFKNDVMMDAVNMRIYGLSNNGNRKIGTPEAKAVFFHRMIHDDSRAINFEPIDKLKACFESNQHRYRNRAEKS